jgi:hypothetical protein
MKYAKGSKIVGRPPVAPTIVSLFAFLRLDFFSLFPGMERYNGSQRPPVESLVSAPPFIESGRCGLWIASFHGDGAPS